MLFQFLNSPRANYDDSEDAPLNTAEEPESNVSKGPLQSNELEVLLNMIDGLRAQGVGRFIDLPQMIVCGDQSSGKSSVLEAISGVRFPTKSTLCTRFPTELILRRSPQPSMTISILPDHKRDSEDKERLEAFDAGFDPLADFGAVVEAAGREMGLETASKEFKNDVLRVELAGPEQPNLTLVDLPGFFHASSIAQSAADSAAIESLVTEYAKKPRTVILAVVAASHEYVCQVVTEFALKVDPLYTRTLGIITKPDKLDVGSETERGFLEIAENKNTKLRLGWHVLKNRDFATRDSSVEERDQAEAEFFSKGIWSSLPSTQKGIEALKSRLGRIIRELILTELPSLMKDVEVGIEESSSLLDRLGTSRATKLEQRMYLLRISQSFCKVMQDAVKGHYEDQYFGEKSRLGYPKRIRATVANLLQDFATDIGTKGKQYVIVQGPVRQASSQRTPIQMTKEERLQGVARVLRENRGQELPGLMKFETVTNLFREQCQPWEELVKSCMEDIFGAVQQAVDLALDHYADHATKQGISRLILDPALDEMKAMLDAEVKRNLQQHMRGHPITFNHYFTDNIQKLRNQHQADFLRPKLLEFFNSTEATSDGDYNRGAFSVNALLLALTNNTEADMNTFACTEALYYMEAYYKVALKFFVDDFSIHTIEQGLLDKLELLFDQAKVLSLTDDQVEEIAGESRESRDERARLSTKLTALTGALTVLRRLDRGHHREISTSQLP